MGDACLATQLDGLNQIDDPHVVDRTAEARFPVAQLELLTLPFLQQDINPGDDLLYVDRLGEVVVDAKLETANLVFHRFLVGQENERDMSPLRFGLELFAQLITVHRLHLGVRDDKIGRGDADFLDRVLAIDGGCDRVTGLTEADLHNPQGFGISVNQQKVSSCHGNGPDR